MKRGKKIGFAILIAFILLFVSLNVLQFNKNIRPADPVSLSDERIHEKVTITEEDLKSLITVVRNNSLIFLDTDPLLGITMSKDGDQVNVYTGIAEENGRLYTFEKKEDQWMMVSKRKIQF